MTLEQKVLVIIWLLCIFAVIFIVPKKQIRNFVIAVLIAQAIMWLDATLLVQFELIRFPVREFPQASNLLFTSEYLLYPVLFGFFMLFMPNKGLLVRTLYFIVWVSGVSLLDYGLQTYTNLIEYINYWTWPSFALRYLVNIFIYRWFFKDESLFYVDKKVAQ